MAFNTRQLGFQNYQDTLDEMQSFTANRTNDTLDELWVLDHPPVYTLGLNGKRDHILQTTDSIPVIQTDRGGQVTFHGPGQLVIYTLVDIDRLQLGVHKFVTILEQAIIHSLAQYGIPSQTKAKAPGVYVDKQKIASIGLRIKKGCSYHGISVNNQMDLRPFDNINTCGYPDLEVTSLEIQGVNIANHELAVPIIHSIVSTLNI